MIRWTWSLSFPNFWKIIISVKNSGLEEFYHFLCILQLLCQCSLIWENHHIFSYRKKQAFSGKFFFHVFKKCHCFSRILQTVSYFLLVLSFKVRILQFREIEKLASEREKTHAARDIFSFHIINIAESKRNSKHAERFILKLEKKLAVEKINDRLKYNGRRFSQKTVEVCFLIVCF